MRQHMGLYRGFLRKIRPTYEKSPHLSYGYAYSKAYNAEVLLLHGVMCGIVTPNTLCLSYKLREG